MRNQWFFSDPHFGHTGILKFTRRDSSVQLVRPGFADVDAMDEAMIENWNSVVRDGDYVYVGGDVTWKVDDRFSQTWSRLKGRKRLILGNHDDPKKLAPFFQKIYVWRVFSEHRHKFTLTHVPIHPLSIKGAFNVHGHTHTDFVTDGYGFIDRRYINICVEQINYTPMSIDELLSEMDKRSTLQL